MFNNDAIDVQEEQERPVISSRPSLYEAGDLPAQIQMHGQTEEDGYQSAKEMSFEDQQNQVRITDENMVRFTDEDQIADPADKQEVRFTDDDEDNFIDEDDDFDEESENEYISDQQREQALLMLQAHNQGAP